MPDLTPAEVELKTKKTTNRFLEKYSEKSDEDLKRLANEDLIPEAQEALNQIMKNKQHIK